MSGTIPATGRPGGDGGTATFAGLRVRLSTFVPPETVIVTSGDVAAIGGTIPTAFVNPAAHDRYGSPPWFLRAIDPRPGFTRHSAGVRELERDRRLTAR